MNNRKLKVTEMGRISIEEFRQSKKMPLVVILDDVRSMYNVGSVFRTADAYRVESICLCGITARPPHAEIHKTALGAEDSVNWTYYADTNEAVAALQDKGYTVLAVEQAEGSIKLQHLEEALHTLTPQTPTTTPARYAIVMGNEVKGVKQTVVDRCNGCIELPQYGTKHSLNVSTTAGIVIWEFARMLLIHDSMNE